MARGRTSRLTFVLLSLNVALLGLIALRALSRTEIFPAALAQVPPSPNSPVVVAPGQLATNIWGCYVLDTRSNTLCVYQYSPGDKMLRLQAARGLEQDMQLRSFNTTPLPAEVAELIEKERRLQSGQPATRPAPADSK